MDENEAAYSFCGSPEYMAPEMLLKVGHTYPVDYYCLGALLYELVRRKRWLVIFDLITLLSPPAFPLGYRSSSILLFGYRRYLR